VNPAFVLTQGRSSTSISAQASASGTLDRVGYAILRNGLNDVQSTVWSTGVMMDDGMNGDARAGDGIFTNASVRTDCCAVVGPRTVRIKAEARAGDGKRYATVVEIAPFAVVTDTPPAGNPSAAASIAGTWNSDFGPVTFAYGTVTAGQPIPITGFWIQAADKRGVIQSGSFDPVSGRVQFSYFQNWNNVTGSAQLQLSADGKTLSGTWMQPGSSGTWTMTR
jgi:hypothetical protein